MKLDPGFVTHNLDDKQIMVSAGSVPFSGMIRSNKTAAEIVDLLKTETTKEEIVSSLLDKYDVAEDVLTRDVEKILAILRTIGALHE